LSLSGQIGDTLGFNKKEDAKASNLYPGKTSSVKKGGDKLAAKECKTMGIKCCTNHRRWKKNSSPEVSGKKGIVDRVRKENLRGRNPVRVKIGIARLPEKGGTRLVAGQEKNDAQPLLNQKKMKTGIGNLCQER